MPEVDVAPAPVVPAFEWTGDQDKDLATFIRSGSYYKRILLYEPIPILQLQEDLRAAGLKIAKANLAPWLDAKGILFSDPASKFR